MDFVRRYLPGQHVHKYALLGQQKAEKSPCTRRHSLLAIIVVLLGGIAFVLVTSVSGGSPPLYYPPGAKRSCDSVYRGFTCQPEISQFWGQYSPYFSVPSEISPQVPEHCEITFAQVLSRHGARDPTASKTEAYAALVDKIKSNVNEFDGPYAFLEGYAYTLGADQLTTFGQQELVNSGVQFYERYHELARHVTPFVRASGEDRVVESALNWTQGFRAAKMADRGAKHGSSAYPVVDVVIPEADFGVNNTLNHALCTEFENGTYGEIGNDAKGTWAEIFAQPIRAQLNHDLPGAGLTIEETIYMMDLCPFNTVASSTGRLSDFCGLFAEEEWHQYGYYETLDKWYGYSYGNPLGPAQGIGFANELIARMTDRPVQNVASINSTLDHDPETFPLRKQLYADFSHDNDMTAIFAALGLYNETDNLPTTAITEASDAKGYSAAWTVPFAARAYFEKMRCHGHDQELVRVIINDRVLPLELCDEDSLGRCTLSAFIDSMRFATSGGNWMQCFRSLENDNPTRFEPRE